MLRSHLQPRIASATFHMPIGRYVVSCAFWICAAGPVARADEATLRWGQQAVDAGNRTIGVLIEDFRPVFPKEHRDLLSNDRIKVVVAADYNAFADYEKRRILIPAQFVNESLLQVQAIILVQSEPSLRSRYLEWVKYLTERSLSVRDRARAGGPNLDDVPIKPFWMFAGQPHQEMSQRDQNIQEKMMTDAMALVVGHELGHLVLRHKRYDQVSASRSREQEYEADEFATTLLRRADLSVMAGLSTFFLRFASREAIEKGSNSAEETHPPAHCRFYRIGARELEAVLRDPQARPGFERSSGMTVAQAKQALTELREECRNR